MPQWNWFRNVTFLNRQRPASGSTQQAGSQAKLQAGERRPDTSGSTTDILFEEIESEITEQFRLREILEEACLVTGATGAAIALARGKEMVCCANAGADAPDLGVCLDLHQGLSGNCIQTRRLQQCADTETDPRVDRQVCRELGVRSLAVLPLLQGSELLGVFEVLSSRPNAFGQNELRSLRKLGDQILPVKVKEMARPIRSHVAKPAQRQREPKNHAALTNLLGVLVIAVALLLGTVVGWRFGWQRATRQIRNGATMHRSNAQPKVGRSNEIPLAETPCQSAVSDVSENRANQLTTP